MDTAPDSATVTDAPQNTAPTVTTFKPLFGAASEADKLATAAPTTGPTLPKFVLNPQIGDMVLFTDEIGVDYPAIITFVWSGGMVNLHAFGIVGPRSETPVFASVPQATYLGQRYSWRAK